MLLCLLVDSVCTVRSFFILVFPMLIAQATAQRHTVDNVDSAPRPTVGPLRGRPTLSRPLWAHDWVVVPASRGLPSLTQTLGTRYHSQAPQPRHFCHPPRQNSIESRNNGATYTSRVCCCDFLFQSCDADYLHEYKTFPTTTMMVTCIRTMLHKDDDDDLHEAEDDDDLNKDEDDDLNKDENGDLNKDVRDKAEDNNLNKDVDADSRQQQ
ncbi:hypothetical protein BDZ89DRAFT_1191098 [Hymenopellis radicata]|nr:hypothetical protein BDZ89DRAFT_1191098 [Hymenopellis radicata]